MVWSSSLMASGAYALACFAGSPFSWWGLSVAGLALGLPVYFRGFKASKYYVPALAYVMVQAGGSTMVFLGSSLCMKYGYGWWNDAGMIIEMCGFLMKMGMFPFHFWPGRILGLFSWYGLFMSLTFFKYYIYVAMPNVSGPVYSFLKMSIMGTFVTGALGAMNQLEVKSMVAWYSVMDAGWGASAHLLGLDFMMTYLIINLVVLASVCFFFELHCGINTIKQFRHLGTVGGASLVLLSYIGVFPLLGSVGKAAILAEFVAVGDLPLAAVGIISAVLGGFSAVWFSAKDVTIEFPRPRSLEYPIRLCIWINLLGPLVMWAI